MRRIPTVIWSHQSIKSGEKYSSTDVQGSESRVVNTYDALVRDIAAISFKNPDHILFFRGQAKDYLKNGTQGQRISSFYPTIFRSPGRTLTSEELQRRIERLTSGAEYLIQAFKDEGIEGSGKLGKFPEIAWAILQHYEVCDTPLLDVTHSLRVAASFALESGTLEGHLFVFGFPYPHGSITYSVEDELLNIRLLSICPPEAARPHFQEGFLVGSFPAMRKKRHPNMEVGVRLIAKFKLRKRNFWEKGFHAFPRGTLCPKNDRMQGICDEIKISLEKR